MAGLRGSYRLGKSEGWTNKDYGLHFGGPSISYNDINDDIDILDMNDIEAEIASWYVGDYYGRFVNDVKGPLDIDWL